jgi:hypothetical protein
VSLMCVCYIKLRYINLLILKWQLTLLRQVFTNLMVFNVLILRVLGVLIIRVRFGWLSIKVFRIISLNRRNSELGRP